MDDLEIAARDLETFCAEHGVPVAPHEWEKGWDNGLRIAFEVLRQMDPRVKELAEAAENALSEMAADGRFADEVTRLEKAIKSVDLLTLEAGGAP